MDASVPPRYERKVDGTGREFFVDHVTRTTSWTDPRLRPGFEEGVPPVQPQGAAPQPAAGGGSTVWREQQAQALKQQQERQLRELLGTYVALRAEGVPAGAIEADVVQAARALGLGALPKPLGDCTMDELAHMADHLLCPAAVPHHGGVAAADPDRDEERRRRQQADALLARQMSAQFVDDERRARAAASEAAARRLAEQYDEEDQAARVAALARQRSDEERQRRREADEETARQLADRWQTEDRLREAEAEARRLRRHELDRQGTFIWEFRPAQGPAAVGAGDDINAMEPEPEPEPEPEDAAGGHGTERWVAYDRRQSKLLTEAYVLRTVVVELPGVDTTVDFGKMSHTVRDVAQQFEVRGRMNAQAAPVPALVPDRPVAPETLEGMAMRAGVIQRHIFQSRREFTGAEDDIHFRNAEAQFLRMGGGHKVQQVEYIVNPPLLAAFEAKQREFAEWYGEGGHHTILSFHGTTNDANIENILANNFDIGRLAAGSGDRGYYGAGIYFSERADVSQGYAGGVNKLLLCKLLTGREYKIGGTNPTPGAGGGQRMLGAPLQAGYDSHVVNDGQEVVIFDAVQILPCYVIHWTAGGAAGI